MPDQHDYGGRLVAANAFATASGWINRTAVPLAIYTLTGSAVQTAVAFAISHLPAITVGLVGGVVADRFDSARVSKLTLFGSALFILCIAWTISVDALLPLTYLALFLNSSLSAIQLPAFQALVAHSCPPHRLLDINVRLGAADQTNSVLMPALGGGLLMAFPPALVFVLSAALYLGALAVLWPLSAPGAGKGTALRTLQGIRDGFAIIHARPELASGVMTFALSNFSTTLLQSTVVAILAMRFELGSYQIGLFFAAAGVFGIAGHAAASKVALRLPLPALLAVNTLACSGLTALMIIAPSAQAFALLWGSTILLGAVNVTAFNTHRQLCVGPAEMGRAVAASRVLTYFPIPVAAGIAGPVLHLLGPAWLIAFSATMRLLGVCVCLASPFNLSMKRAS
ncbi:MFS transporter [Sphingomonas sp. S2-65]|uniref:MFS transporter n=1 Tax=Sphingomonas sp. S2-65 TaxID=2903960 RepID=UPI001F16AFB1|nr:MFS transporter [Sphingomonas sp. S2-65]UYY58827.1 MFS transporter [Sphingomonas sp. S2-65]